MSLHVECGQGGAGPNGQVPIELSGLLWSETIAGGETTTNSASLSGNRGPVSLTLTAIDEAGYFAIGTDTPSAAADPRRYLASGQTRSFAVERPGEKVTWVSA